MKLTSNGACLDIISELVIWCPSWQLTCLVLPHEHCNLLETKSIWSADKTVGTCSLVENILHLEPVEVFFYFYFFWIYTFASPMHMSFVKLLPSSVSLRSLALNT